MVKAGPKSITSWTVGDLKIRGKGTSMLQFMRNGFYLVDFEDDPTKEVQIEETPGTGVVEVVVNPNPFGLRIGIKDTTMFFTEEAIYATYQDVTVIENVCSPDFVDISGLKKVSKHYGIDFRIHSFNPFLEKEHVVEIHKGKVVKDKVIEFDDYEWESARSQLGG